MKNAIMYYYNLIPDNIRLINKYVKFNVDNTSYVLEKLERNPEELNDIYELSNYLLQHNVLCHQIIPNINNQIITIINDSSYVLMKIFVDVKKNISEEDLFVFSNIIIDKGNFNKIRRDNWLELWTNKIDYLEYQVSQFGKKYMIIRDSFSYYIGLAENAIQFLKTVNHNYMLCVSHIRIKKDYTLYDLYNPLEFIIDSRVRDYSEYFKQKYCDLKIDYLTIENYILKSNLTLDEIKLFFSRMMFPTMYFDLYEDIVIDGISENELIPLITKVNDYELLIKKIYYLLFNYWRVDVIEWLMTIT